MKDIRVVGLSLGTFSAVSFVVCVLWGLSLPEALHMHGFLELVLPGFKWISVGYFALGLLEAFLFGLYAGVVYTAIRNFFAKRFEA